MLIGCKMSPPVLQSRREMSTKEWDEAYGNRLVVEKDSKFLSTINWILSAPERVLWISLVLAVVLILPLYYIKEHDRHWECIDALKSEKLSDVIRMELCR